MPEKMEPLAKISHLIQQLAIQIATGYKRDWCSEYAKHISNPVKCHSCLKYDPDPSGACVWLETHRRMKDLFGGP